MLKIEISSRGVFAGRVVFSIKNPIKATNYAPNSLKTCVKKKKQKPKNYSNSQQLDQITPTQN
jgi:hypothetical protein